MQVVQCSATGKHGREREVRGIYKMRGGSNLKESGFNCRYFWSTGRG
jgi:hypothetical protein